MSLLAGKSSNYACVPLICFFNIMKAPANSCDIMQSVSAQIVGGKGQVHGVKSLETSSPQFFLSANNKFFIPCHLVLAPQNLTARSDKKQLNRDLTFEQSTSLGLVVWHALGSGCKLGESGGGGTLLYKLYGFVRL